MRTVATRSASLLSAAAFSAFCAAQTPNETLAAMSEAERHEFFLATIRDAGFVCDDVLSAKPAYETSVHWRIVCADVLAYLASIGLSGTINIWPLPYTDGPQPLR